MELLTMTNKTFAVAGVSTLKGVTKVRFANDMTRVKILVKGGHENIDLVSLTDAMTKGEAVKALMGMDMMNDPLKADAIRTADAKYNGSVKVTKQEVSLDSIKARVLEGSVAVEAEVA
jgi:hypothetical protein